MRSLLLTLLLTLLLIGPPAVASDDFEVWLVDQSNKNGTSYGGMIHIYDGDSLIRDLSATTPADTIDLGGATSALCMASTGANPVRPHMLVFNSTDQYAALAFVASGHVVFFKASTRQPLACFRTEPGAGGARQAHAAWATEDDRYVLVANQNGKKLERIRTDYANEQFTLEPAATLNLATCTTANGLPCQDATLRPDNAPICPFNASDNGPAFVSLRGGGLLVVDWETTPMSIVGEYDKASVPANGCGFIEAKGWVYGNGGGATAANLDQFTVYRVPRSGYSPSNAPNTPAVELLFDDPAVNRDAHGVAVSKHERYVWIGDRDANVAEVFDASSGSRVATVDLASAFTADPAPDLFAPSPGHKYLFASARGSIPLSGDPHSSQGAAAGMLIVRVYESGSDGRVEGFVRISNVDAAGVDRADAHGIRSRIK